MSEPGAQIPEPDATGRLYFEDMPVGLRATTGSILIDAAAIKDFAARFDPQPFHLDEDAAAKSFFILESSSSA